MIEDERSDLFSDSSMGVAMTTNFGSKSAKLADPSFNRRSGVTKRVGDHNSGSDSVTSCKNLVSFGPVGLTQEIEAKSKIAISHQQSQSSINTLWTLPRNT